MPAFPAALEDALHALFDAPGPTTAACAASWADAFSTYAASCVPASGAVAGAKAALASAMAAAFAAPPAAAAMEAACTAWALAIGGGMAGFVPTPPPAPVGFAALFTEPYPSSHAVAADVLSQAVDTWFKTGTATPASGGSPVNWG